MKRVPVVNPSKCSDCDSCLELCPGIFKRNPETGLIEVVDLNHYPEHDVQVAINMCPADCIAWEQNDQT
jgi:ferredoxin